MFIKDKSFQLLNNSPGKAKSGVVVNPVAPDDSKVMQSLLSKVAFSLCKTNISNIWTCDLRLDDAYADITYEIALHQDSAKLQTTKSNSMTIQQVIILWRF